eukprot:SAG22_NODE_621_length_8504_cov_3.476859_6_plen_513_part_00
MRSLIKPGPQQQHGTQPQLPSFAMPGGEEATEQPSSTMPGGEEAADAAEAAPLVANETAPAPLAMDRDAAGAGSAAPDPAELGLSRPIDASELMFLAVERAGQQAAPDGSPPPRSFQGFQMGCRLKGRPLQPERLQAALRQVIAHQPMLAVSPTGPVQATTDQAQPPEQEHWRRIPLAELELPLDGPRPARDGENLETVLLQMANATRPAAPGDSRDRPLFDVVCLNTREIIYEGNAKKVAEGCEIAVHFSHSIADGSTGLLFFRQLLGALGGAPALPDRSSWPLPGPLFEEAGFQLPFGWCCSSWNPLDTCCGPDSMSGLLCTHMWEWTGCHARGVWLLPARAPTPSLPAGNEHDKQRRTGLEFLTIDQPCMTALLEAARARSSTIHSVLVAACQFALARVIHRRSSSTGGGGKPGQVAGKASLKFRVASPMNLRAREWCNVKQRGGVRGSGGGAGGGRGGGGGGGGGKGGGGGGGRTHTHTHTHRALLCATSSCAAVSRSTALCCDHMYG